MRLRKISRILPLVEQLSSSQELDLIPPHAELLNRVSTAVTLEEIVSPEVQALIDRMFTIAQGEQGNPERPTMVGLAAPQIGVSKRIILVGVDAEGNGEPPHLQVFINPVITYTSTDTILGREGCYSTGRVCGVLERPAHIRGRAYDRLGNIVPFEAEGFVARIFQHEIDHLDGIRFPDRIHDPARLHWVPLDQFGDYRQQWATWTQLCPPEQWLAIKQGVTADIEKTTP